MLEAGVQGQGGREAQGPVQGHRLIDIIYLETLVWIERSLKLVITLRDERILKLVTMINVQGRNEISMRWTKRP